MADLVDIASNTVEVCVAEAERRARGKSAPETDPRFDGLHCVEDHCGVEIPAGSRSGKFVVWIANRYERKGKYELRV